MFLNTVFLEILMFFSETRQLSFPIVVIKKKFYLLCVFLKDKRFASLFPKSKFCNETLVKPGSYGIHDTMRDGITSAMQDAGAAHPLQLSEKSYHRNIQRQEFSALRNAQGLHMPMKLQMERTILSRVHRLPGLESSRASLRSVLDDYDLGFEDMLCGPRHSYSLVADRDAFERNPELLP